MKNSAETGPLSIIVIDVGNTSTRMARWVEGNVEDVVRVPTGESGSVHDALAGVRDKCENTRRQAIVIASVVPQQTGSLVAFIENELDLRAFVVGDNTPLPAEVALIDPSSVGTDRVCAAAAAFERTEHACVVIDAGSAITVDLIDNDGVYQGGSIFPGIGLQARALAEWTARLPLVEPVRRTSALGKNTTEAIAGGLCFGVAAAIRGLVEQIATECNYWPQTILTGGGGAFLKDYMDFVDSWVPDLCLMGVGLAYMKRVRESSAGRA